MRFDDFLKDKILQIILLLVGFFTIEIFLVCFSSNIFLKIYMVIRYMLY